MSTTTTATVSKQAKAALRQAWQHWPDPDWQPLMDEFLSLPQLERARTVLLFYGVGKEPDTRALICALLRKGKRVALPRCMPGRQMEMRLIHGLEGLIPSAYGIPEPGEVCPLVRPNEIDLALVPNLCCDRAGYRLGHGGGYYDRWLAQYEGFTVALCPEIWMQEQVPRDRFDRPVDLVITE